MGWQKNTKRLTQDSRIPNLITLLPAVIQQHSTEQQLQAGCFETKNIYREWHQLCYILISEAKFWQQPHLQHLPTEVKPTPDSSISYSTYQQKWSQRLTVASPTAPTNNRSEAKAWKQPRLEHLPTTEMKPRPDSSLTYSTYQQKWGQSLKTASPRAPTHNRSEAKAWQ